MATGACRRRDVGLSVVVTIATLRVISSTDLRGWGSQCVCVSLVPRSRGWSGSTTHSRRPSTRSGCVVFTAPRDAAATPPAPSRYCTCYCAVVVRVCAGQTRIAATAQSQTTVAQDLTRLRHELARHAHSDAVAARAAGDFHASGTSASLGQTATYGTVDSYVPQ